MSFEHVCTTPGLLLQHTPGCFCVLFQHTTFTVHMSHRLALLGCLGIVACASLMQSTACSGEQNAEVPAGEDDH